MCEIVRMFCKAQLNTRDIILLILWYSRNHELCLIRLLIALINLSKYIIDDITTLLSKESDFVKSMTQLINEKLIYVRKYSVNNRVDYTVKLTDKGILKARNIVQNLQYSNLILVNGTIVIESKTLINDLIRVISYVNSMNMLKLLNDLVTLITQYLQDKYSTEYKVFLFLVQDFINHVHFNSK